MLWKVSDRDISWFEIIFIPPTSPPQQQEAVWADIMMQKHFGPVYGDMWLKIEEEDKLSDFCGAIWSKVALLEIKLKLLILQTTVWWYLEFSDFTAKATIRYEGILYSLELVKNRPYCGKNYFWLSP